VAISYFCAHCGAENAPGAAHCHACRHPLDPSAGGDHKGALLHARYEILSEIGSGGFGAVYKARDTHQDGRLVAVKQINLQGLSSQQIIEATDAFNREADILSTLRHPMLPRIFDRFSDPQHWYLVMSLIEGQTLEDYLHHKLASATTTRPGLSLEETLSIGVQVCDALNYLHRQQPPVIFRDLKPGNLMRTANGRLYLIDFGIARRFKPGQLKDTIPFGSPGFAAPEQYGKAQTTPQADLYSLGALLYTLISGDDPSEHPFQFPPLRVYGTDGIRELGTLIQRLVSLAPEHRPATIEEVRAELQRIQHLHALVSSQGHLWIPPQGQTPSPFPAVGSRQQQIFLTPSGQQPRARKTSRRRVLTIGLIAGGALAVFGIAGIVGNQPAQPFISKDNQSGNATAIDQALAVPLNGPTFWSPDLSHAAVMNGTKNQIEIYKAYDQQPIRTIGMPASFSNPAISWSVDNNKIALQADTGIVYAWNVKTGQSLLEFGFSSTSAATIAWSPDGQYCAIGYGPSSHSAHLTVLTSDGVSFFQTSLPVYDSPPTNNLAWSPDSKYLAFPGATEQAASNTAWQVNIWDTESQQIIDTFSRMFSSHHNSIASIAWSTSGKKVATIADDTIWIHQFHTSQSVEFLTDIAQELVTSGPIWSPNEEYVALLLDPIANQNTLAVYDTSQGQAVNLTNDGWQSYPNAPSTANNLAAFAWASDSKSIIAVDKSNIISSWQFE
jgi:serine/threonine protein kinase